MTDASETKAQRLREGTRQQLERLEQLRIGDIEGIAASMALSLDLAVEKLERELAEARAEATDAEFHRKQCFDSWQSAREENARLREKLADTERIMQLILEDTEECYTREHVVQWCIEMEDEPPAEEPGPVTRAIKRVVEDVSEGRMTWRDGGPVSIEPPAEEADDQ